MRNRRVRTTRPDLQGTRAAAEAGRARPNNVAAFDPSQTVQDIDASGALPSITDQTDNSSVSEFLNTKDTTLNSGMRCEG